jgi:hypothetical protein
LYDASPEQARAMREEVQKMVGRVAALQAHCNTLEGEAERWQQLWRQAAASNAQLTARISAGQEHPGEVGFRTFSGGFW